MLSLTNIHVIPHELLYPIPPNQYTFTLTYLLPNCYVSLPAASVNLGGGGVGVVPLTPSRTPVSSMIYVLPYRSSGAAPHNTASSATTGSMTVRVLPVKSVITLQVKTRMTSIGSLTTASAKLQFLCWI